MNKKSLYILLTLFIIVVGVLVVSRWLQTRQEKKVADVPIAKALKEISVGEVSEIEVTQGEERVKLTKQEGRWTVSGKRVDADQVEQAIKGMLEAAYSGSVSRAPENFDKLEVGEKGLMVILRAGENSIGIHIGKSGPTFDSSYARLEGSDETYLADKNLAHLFEARSDFWQSKKIADVNPDQVARVVVREGGREQKAYRKEGDKWLEFMGTSSTTTDEAVMQGVLNSLHPLTASGFVNEDKDRAAFVKEKPKTKTLSIFNAEGSTLAAIVFLKREGEWWAQAEGEDQIYRVPQYAVEALKVE